MAADDVRSEAQCAAYPFEADAIVAPEDLNPDGFMGKPPVGTHTFEVIAFEVAVNHRFTNKGEEAVLNQLRPTLAIAVGPHAGARITDFLPMPTPGTPMPTWAANRWANFLQGLGFTLPVDENGRKLLAPKGFKIGQIKGPKVVVKVVQKTDREGNPVLFRGEPDVQVGFFGYTSVEQAAAKAAGFATAAGKPSAAPSKAADWNTKPAKNTTSAEEIDL